MQSRFRQKKEGVYFINILRAAFTHEDPESFKNWWLDNIFCKYGITDVVQFAILK